MIGCGIIGLEMAAVYDALGSKITAVELFDQPIPGCDPDVVRPLQRRITERYEAVHLDTKVESVQAADDGLRVKLITARSTCSTRSSWPSAASPTAARLDASAAGVEVDDAGFIRVDAQLRTNVGHIYAIGDVVGGPMLAHKASHEGHTAAEVIAGVPGASFDPRSIPSVAYTDPEVAWTGLTETAAKADGIEYEKAVFPWAASGRALSLARSEGMTKLLFEPDSHRLLGAGIVGVGAGELIAEAVHAIEMGSDAEDIALSIHPHPTLSETVGFAAEIAAGTITDILPAAQAGGFEGLELGGQQGPDQGRDRARLGVDPPLGEPDHPVAGDLQLRVAAAVGLELLARAVVPVAVDLDDELLIAPDRVDQLAFDQDVALRLGEPGVADQRQEAILQLRLGPWGRARQLCDRASAAAWRRGGAGSARARPRARDRSAAPSARSSPASLACAGRWLPMRGRGRSAPTRSPGSRRRPLHPPRAARAPCEPEPGWAPVSHSRAGRSHRSARSRRPATSQTASANRWLRSASGPHASTAAIQYPFSVSLRWPTA